MSSYSSDDECDKGLTNLIKLEDLVDLFDHVEEVVGKITKNDKKRKRCSKEDTKEDNKQKHRIVQGDKTDLVDAILESAFIRFELEHKGHSPTKGCYTSLKEHLKGAIKLVI